MRLAIEKTRQDFDPEAPVMIVWGLVCMIGYWAMHFLLKQQLYNWIWPVLIPLFAIGIIVATASGIIVAKRQKKAGSVSLISNQIGWIWMIAVAHGSVWSTLAFQSGFFGGRNYMSFIWALVYSIALSVTGVISTKEWLWGGIGIFVGMVAAFIFKDYALLILGFAMGAGCIIPGIIAQRRYLRQKRENG
jgi:hypothetical protein